MIATRMSNGENVKRVVGDLTASKLENTMKRYVNDCIPEAWLGHVDKKISCMDKRTQ